MKPVVTEKAIMKIESENALIFKLEKEKTKTEIAEEVEKLFDVKIDKVRTMIRNGKKYAYVKLNKKFPAIDLATKLGLM